MDAAQLDRYARQIVLKEIGGAGQQALLKSRIAIVGAGGLGGPAALYLAAAGAGHITLIDDDAVSLSNLQRQVQFTTAQTGQSKVSAAASGLKALNTDLSVGAEQDRLTSDNAAALLANHDVILDGCDNFETRFATAAAARALNVPLVSGAVGRWDGQLASFNHAQGTACYRCFVPSAPPDAETCAQVGIVGALTGVIGSAMALEAIKIITGAGTPLYNRLWLFDGLNLNSHTVRLQQDPACQFCG